MALPELKSFRLVGGTSLALQYGHRTSKDIDLFTDRTFDSDQLKSVLIETFSSNLGEIKTSRNGITTSIYKIKLDLVNWAVPFIREIITSNGIRLMNPEEIFAMKLDALSGRQEKKDYYDIDELLRHYSFEQAVSFYKEKYPYNSIRNVLENFGDFTEADKSPEPLTIFKDRTWDSVRQNVTKHYNDYLTSQKQKINQESEERISRAEKLLEERKKKKK